jgi:hypothetical protein
LGNCGRLDLLQNFGPVVLMLSLFIWFSRPLYSGAKLKCHLYVVSHTAGLAATRHKALTLR